MRGWTRSPRELRAHCRDCSGSTDRWPETVRFKPPNRSFLGPVSTLEARAPELPGPGASCIAAPNAPPHSRASIDRAPIPCRRGRHTPTAARSRREPHPSDRYGRRPHWCHHALESDRPELIAVYGRRRVGKTYLIRGFFAEQICFELTGARDANLKEQLTNFVRVLETRCPIRLRCRPRGRTRSRC